MILTRSATAEGTLWALDGQLLPPEIDFARIAATRRAALPDLLRPSANRANGILRSPVEPGEEVWASGVTYRRSLVEREAESVASDVYGLVYEAERPELFFKALGSRTVGDGGTIRIRRDSAWNVPEPELVLVVNAHREIIGYTAGNDVSSRSIEGENPLYLPQAKCYDGACAVGPGIVLTDDPGRLEIRLRIVRGGSVAFAGGTSTDEMKRAYGELVEFLTREMAFPQGVFLMTGTGIVPGADFTLLSGDRVEITVGEITLTNHVA